MKPIHLLAFVSLIVAMSAITGCQKGNGYMGAIKITGPNNSQPACSPNFNAVWQGTTTTDSFVGIRNTAMSIGISNTTVFPVYMNINWTNSGICGFPVITITKYQKL